MDSRWLDYNALVKFKLLSPSAILPVRGTRASGAFDIYAPELGFVDPGESLLIPLGIAHEIHPGLSLEVKMSLPDGTHRMVDMPLQLQGILMPRSGFAAKHRVRLFFSPCLIDHDYRGQIHVMLENKGEDTFRWKAGDRICQMAYIPMYMGPTQETDYLTDTERGEGGFHSTGGHSG